jgi:3-hydroxyacyl-[acyl-carrier-protein] dehydratase
MDNACTVDAALLGLDDIRAVLPHREPFLFIEKVLVLERQQRIVCLKNISHDDPILSGHFPGFAVMPGVLTLEAIAQAALLLALLSYPERRGQLGVLRAAKSRFHRMVVPGDQLIIEARIDKIVQNGCAVSGKATVEGEKAATAELIFGIVDRRVLSERRQTPSEHT